MDSDLIERARADVGVFAQALIGEPLWPHQLEVARSQARHRSLCSGRQAGKSRTLAVVSLHEAFVAPERRVLILSAGEDAARNLLAEVSMLARSPLLAGSVVDENLSQVVLSNGSWIRSVPASAKRIRGLAVDLLVIDEACFVDDELWSAAKYTTLARPGSRVLLASTPWGGPDRFFAVAWRAGERGVEGYASWRWPSTASPLVDESLLELWRSTEPDYVYRREVLAEWVEDSGSYFTAAELEAAVREYELVPPSRGDGRVVSAGVDWGFAPDASALVLLARATHEDFEEVPDVAPVRRGDDPRPLFVPWLEAESGVAYAQWVERVVAADEGYALRRVMSEQNGVGAMPTQELAARLAGVTGVYTDARNKETAFGGLKVALQAGRLFLPRHPELLKQLSSLRFEARESGVLHISVPERLGHDDLAMALVLAAQAEPGVGVVGRKRGGLRYRSGGETAPAGLGGKWNWSDVKRNSWGS